MYEEYIVKYNYDGEDHPVIFSSYLKALKAADKVGEDVFIHTFVMDGYNKVTISIL